MSLPTYPLPPAALGSGYAINLDDVSLANAWALRELEVPVTLAISGAGWLVHGPRGYLGLVTKDLTERYPDLMRVFRSGLAPAAQAVIAPLDDGSGHIDIVLPLPAPPFLVPVGRAGGEVLAQGQAVEVDLALDFATPCQVLVDLDVAGSQVVALYDGQLLGGVAHPPPKLAEAVRSRRLSARVFVAEGRGFLDVSPTLESGPVPALRVPDPPVLGALAEGAEAGAGDAGSIILPAESSWLESPERRHG